MAFCTGTSSNREAQGTDAMKRDTPEERIHLRAVAYLAMGIGRAYFFHCPNESAVPPQYRAKLKKLGVSKGVPDLIVVHCTMDKEPGLALELKSKKGRISAAQEEWLCVWEQAGFRAEVTYGHQHTASVLLECGYIGQEQHNSWVRWASTQDPENV